MTENAYLELLLKIRRQQPAEWELLDPAMKLEALQHEARQRERLELDEEDETPEAA